MFKSLCLDIITGRAVRRSLCWNKVSMEEITTLWNIFHLSSRFLREELSSTQLSLLSSRSEVSTLLEELTTYRSGKEWKEEFPDLLLSSLDKLYQDKQQQLYLVRKIMLQDVKSFYFYISDFWDSQQYWENKTKKYQWLWRGNKQQLWFCWWKSLW